MKEFGVGRLSGLGLQFAATIGVFGVLGHLLDGRLGTEPWLMIAGVFLGAAGGFFYMVRTVFPGGGGRPPAAGASPP